MGTREAIIDEIKDAPAPLVRELYDYLRFLKCKVGGAGLTSPGVRTKPDFLARQKSVFGERVLTDSQSELDELRADRI